MITMIMILIMRGGICGGEGVRKQIRSRPRPSLTLCALLWIISYFVCNAMMIHFHSRKLKAKVRTLGTKNVINRNIRTTQSPKRYGVEVQFETSCYQHGLCSNSTSPARSLGGASAKFLLFWISIVCLTCVNSGFPKWDFSVSRLLPILWGSRFL